MVDDSARHWLFDTFAWALRELGVETFYGQTELVLPTDTFFPDAVSTGGEAAQYLFDRVASYAGVADWDIQLVPESPDPDLAAGLDGAHEGSTFLAQWHDPGGSGALVLTYNADLVRRPEQFVAVIARQLSLVIMGDLPVPGGEDYVWHAADVTTVFTGFGVFLVNVAEYFEQVDEADFSGWRTSRLGTLEQSEILYALAIFLVMKKIDTDDVTPHLARKLRRPLVACVRDVRSRVNEIGRLRSVGAPSGVAVNQPDGERDT